MAGDPTDLAFAPAYLDEICAACGSARREHLPGGTRYGPTTLCGAFIPAESEPPLINHDEAAQLAAMRANRSNLARCYLDLRSRLTLLTGDELADAIQAALHKRQPKVTVEEIARVIWTTRYPDIAFISVWPQKELCAEALAVVELLKKKGIAVDA